MSLDEDYEGYKRIYGYNGPSLANKISSKFNVLAVILITILCIIAIRIYEKASVAIRKVEENEQRIEAFEAALSVVYSDVPNTANSIKEGEKPEKSESNSMIIKNHETRIALIESTLGIIPGSNTTAPRKENKKTEEEE